MDFKKIKFINLHNHTTYSILDGVGTVKEHIQETYEKGHSGCCITDHGNMNGSLDLYFNAKDSKFLKKIGIKNNFPIVMGVELYITEDITIKSSNNKYHHITVYAKNYQGYQNLCKLNALANQEDHFYTRPRISLSELFKYKEGLIITSSCFLGYIPQSIFKNKGHQAKVIKELINNKEELENFSTWIQMQRFNKFLFYSKSKKQELNECLSTMIQHKDSFSMLKKLLSEINIFRDFLDNKKFPIKEDNLKGINKILNDHELKKFKLIFNELESEELLQLFKKEFNDDFYIEIHPHNLCMIYDKSTQKHIDQGFNPLEKVNKELFKLSDKYNIKKIIAQDSHMPKKEHYKVQTTMIWNSSSGKGGWHFPEPYAIMSIEDMYNKMKKSYPWITDDHFKNMCDNTIEILNKCKDLSIETNIKVPKFPLEKHNFFKVNKFFHEDFKKILKNNKELSYKDLKTIKEKESIDEIKNLNYSGNILDSKKELLLIKEIQKSKKDLSELSNIFKKEAIGHYLSLAQKDKQLELLFLIIIINNKLRTKEIDKKKLIKVIIKLKKDINTLSPKEIKFIAQKYNCFIKSDKLNHILGSKQYRQRLYEEIKAIRDNGVMNLLDYFLILEDIVRFCDDFCIMRGLGRGSAVSSLLVFALDITDVDPIQYNLPFERFFAKERVGQFNLFIDGYSFDSKIWIKKSKENDLKELEKKFIKERLENCNKNWMQKEINYLKNNKDLCAYLLFLTEKDIKINNEQQSTLIWLLGLSDNKPLKDIEIINMKLPDIDFEINNREMLLDYIQDFYGFNYVSLIGGYNKQRLNGSIRDVLKYNTELSDLEINNFTKNFDGIKGDDKDIFNKVILENSSVRRYLSVNDNLAPIIQGMIGNVKSQTVHPSGIIISPLNLKENIPCRYYKENFLMTQPDMTYLHKVGLLKFDFLTLGTLNELQSVELMTGIKRSEINPNIPKVLREFTKANTDAIFQCKSKLVKDLMLKINRLNSINDLAIVMSIARPGPLMMKMDEMLVERMNNPKSITYLDKLLKPILEETYGIICYQEQIMMIAQKLASFSKIESLNLMYAIKDKNLETMKSFKNLFIKNIVKDTNMNDQKAGELWNLMESFGAYGFNKAHAIAYAQLAYDSMYYQVYHPKEWHSSFLNNDTGGNVKKLYKEWKIASPSFKSHPDQFIVINEEVLAPLSYIKSLNSDHINWIQKFQGNNINDLKKYLRETLVNYKFIKPIILSGILDPIINFQIKDRISLLKLFRQAKKEWSLLEKWTEEDFLEEESKHSSLPITKRLRVNKDLINSFCEKKYLEPLSESLNSYNKEFVYYGMILNSSKFIIKKEGKNKGKDMISGKILLAEKELPFVVFPSEMKYIESIKSNDIVIFKGKMNLNHKKEEQIIMNSIFVWKK